ncbi:nucleotidyltransferase [Limnohabitans sp. TS-CS-82]|uniref:SMODS domain-containing nucleotidyltransferase n=1 Tax=Limnohabitans sp. TS-CS-82 TaxID=2094193 RepID=UPI000CF262F8|nr:nucleotidyltransferase [Limnohabitans sp. TS-CS-82]PQA81989.1 nucleotidyltransferase [Limnohabitans sp. TS-CS-82]
MSIAQYFENFCTQLPIPKAKRDSISDRTATITRRLNTDFRGTDSNTTNSFYGGSYGRNTAIASVSDVDLLYVMPYAVYQQFNGHAGNGQSALLQAVRTSLNKTYPDSAVIADGQIVKIAFTDGITYEIVPVFLNKDNSYTYADSNGGGSWKICKPKHEIDAFRTRNVESNGNLVTLGRMARAWRDKNDVQMSGMLLDTLAYQFMETWTYRDKSYLYYDFMTRDFFTYLTVQDTSQTFWRAPGSGSYVYKVGAFRARSQESRIYALQAIENMANNEHWAAKNKYRQIYGKAFPV